MSNVGQIIGDRFELTLQIGEGGMSKVYIARDLKIDKEWAIKEIAKTDSTYQIENSLMTEANLMKRLDHRNLPRIVDIIQENETIYIVMDYVEGEPLNKVLKEQGPQSYTKVIGWMIEVLEGLDYLHSQNPPIIYRDMKPGNLMLKTDGSIIIIDFGIAREYKNNEEDTTILGTKGYAPPEQYQGKSDPRSDIYALGITMYKLLTGRDTFREEDLPENYNSVQEENLYSVIEKCVQMDPDNRFQTCKEAINALQNPNENLAKNNRKRRYLKIALLLMLSFTITSFVGSGLCFLLSERERTITYNTLIGAPDTLSLEMRRSQIVEAIKLIPTEARAYEALIETYYEKPFTKEEGNSLSALLEKNLEKISRTSDKKDLWYRAGLLYFHRLGEEENLNFGERVRRSYGFFERAVALETDGTWEKENVASCYFTLCKFYKDYVLPSEKAREATALEYMDLIHTLKETIESASKLEEYDRLSLNSAAFMLIFDLRQSFREKGIGLQVVMDAFTLIENEVSSINISRPEALALKGEIQNNLEAYKGIIERTFE